MPDQPTHDPAKAAAQAAIAGADAVRALNELGPELLARLANGTTLPAQTQGTQDENLKRTADLMRNYERTMDIYEKIRNEAEDINNAKR